MGEYEKLHFFGHFFIIKVLKRLYSREMIENLKYSINVEKSAGVMKF